MDFDGPRIALEEEMRSSYLEYAMSVIVARAIPDLRDGLKPVHRRILYSMHENGYEHNKPYKKSALIVGDVMGRYHPHGDGAIYDALVRMAQPFSMSAPLIDGQGNFGSMDGDPPAAMRYTEARMAKLALQFTRDIDKDTVDFQQNYSNDRLEPTVMPCRYPNLLVNGAEGIAVGMATRIPPHNLGEVIDATLALIETPSLEIADLYGYIPGPDFPTGGVILGRGGARKAYTTGKGSIIIRAKLRVEEVRKDRMAIIVDEMPYQVNKANLVEKIAELSRDKKIDGVALVQDESDRHGVRVVIELKRDATPEVVLNQLYRYTHLQVSFGANMLALNGGRPQQLDLKTMLQAFIDFREEVVARRCAYQLRKARERAHVLCGLAVAVENVDEVVALIRSSPDPATARQKLMERRWDSRDIVGYLKLIDDPEHPVQDDGSYGLSEVQARAILDLRLQRLTALGREEITGELEELAAEITDFLDILQSRERIMSIISDELREVREAHAVPRRSEITESLGDFEDEDLIEPEDVIITVTHGGYIKRTPIDEFRAQKRGGKGVQGISMKDEDFVSELFAANTHTPVLFFTTSGIVYKLKAWRLPSSGRNARGKALVNILPINQGETIAAMMPIYADEEEWGNLQIFFATSDGNIRRNELSDFVNVKSNGKIAMKLPEGVSLIGAKICSEKDDVLLTMAGGKAIRFPVTECRVFKGRDSTGVRGVKLAPGDEVVSMAIVGHVETSPDEARSYLKMHRAILGAEMGADDSTEEDAEEAFEDTAISPARYAELSAHEDFILFVSTIGYGKRTSAFEFRPMRRGGQGVIAMDVDKRGGRVVSAFRVEDDDQIMLVTNAGQSIRCPVNEISTQSRGASGVTLFRTADDEQVTSVARIEDSSDDDVGDANEKGQQGEE